MKKEKWIPNCKLKCGIEVQFVSNKKKAPKVKCECGEDIIFVITKRGRYMPIQMVDFLEFDTHYAYCSLADKFRKKVEGKK
ncbi:MAG: hypothetical protein DDT18_01154 [Actinobacteria bacterium]|nr:hypothetical protein [Actinomycetota bacterium]